MLKLVRMSQQFIRDRNIFWRFWKVGVCCYKLYVIKYQQNLNLLTKTKYNADSCCIVLKMESHGFFVKKKAFWEKQNIINFFITQQQTLEICKHLKATYWGIQLYFEEFCNLSLFISLLRCWKEQIQTFCSLFYIYLSSFCLHLLIFSMNNVTSGQGFKVKLFFTFKIEKAVLRQSYFLNKRFAQISHNSFSLLSKLNDLFIPQENQVLFIKLYYKTCFLGTSEDIDFSHFKEMNRQQTGQSLSSCQKATKAIFVCSTQEANAAVQERQEKIRKKENIRSF